METLRKIRRILTKREKIQFSIIALLILIGAILETFGIGLIVPFISLINNPHVIQEHKSLLFVYHLFNVKSFDKFLMIVGIALMVFYLFKNVYIFFVYFVQYRVIFNKQAFLSSRLFNIYLRKPYVFHVRRNSAELLQRVDSDVSHFYGGVIQQILTVFSESLVVACVVTLLFFVEPYITLIACIILGVCSLVFKKVFHKKLGTISKNRHSVLGERYKLLNQSFGAVKEIKVMGKEDFFTKVLSACCVSYSKLNYTFNLINVMPRIIFETSTVIGILTIVLVILAKNGGAGSTMTVLALFVTASFRLMPSATRMSAALALIRNTMASVDAVYRDMFLDIGGGFEKSSAYSSNSMNGKKKDCQYIELIGVSYMYPNSNSFSVKDVSLGIPKNSCVGFIGESGSGKTTLVDIVLGILIPTEGMVVVEGQNIFSDLSSWQKRIGYIPQSISLLDDTIRRNVAFGMPDNEINDDQVWKALESAQLKNFVESLPLKLETSIGERGVRLSGGQRQRIGIARALYYNPKILILDEATSSLDNDTEKEVMNAIEALHVEKTLIIVAHRYSTIQNCDIIFELRGGKLIRKVEKEQILAH
ncbi:MAG TPA: ABC transporter ATP-binding protein [Candidatus Wujingus californicus]|uniref:ABC transporter ATP-binding protein n=1 Tax=Candidatus Wujingus californicus TaxID=3367618 RepID=UPI00402796C1